MDCREIKVDEQVLCSDGTRTDAELLASGLTCQLHWQFLISSLPELVRLGDHERIVGVLIGKDGITVRLETTPSA